MIDTEKILGELNEAQREAVLATEGSVLILAGAGSGKTRVITSRVGYLIGTGRALPHEVTAVTFTNKAAGEMKERLARLLGPDAGKARIGTFHSLCVRILRRHGERIGLSSAFQIYDTADQVGVLKSVLKDLGIDEGAHPPRALLARISDAKNRLLSWERFAAEAVFPGAKTVARCFEEYQKALGKNGAVDFDDLLLETLRLFDTCPDVAERYARGCRYLLVDEYQDTNRPQYRLIRALAAAHGNLCCVGDAEQSIYRFRGADIQNILDFEKDYPRARVIKLERNYRSTKTILKAASAVIERMERRHEKRLWTENEEGLPLHYHRARDDRDEAEAVSRIVASLSESMPTGEIAVLYRTNNQSRLIEEALVRTGIRYRIVGSLRFYERKEIKDILAYLKLLVAPDDDVSFMRAVNTPARGIGKTTLDAIGALAAERSVSLNHAAREAIAATLLPSRAASAVAGFLGTIESLRGEAGLGRLARAAGRAGAPVEGRTGAAPQDAPRAGLNFSDPAEAAPHGTAGDRGSSFEGESFDVDAIRGADEMRDDASPTGPVPRIVPLVGALLETTGFLDHLQKSHPGDHEERRGNVEALVSAAAEYDEQEPGGGLQGFLDRSSLRGDTDDVQGDTGVTLLTVHSAKGLEFGAVVLTGLEENLFPHVRASASPEDLDEERRLCYVAITRAKKRLVLTSAVLRRSFGDFVENAPSRFIEEIPEGLMTYSESSPWAGVEGDPLRSAARAGERRGSRSELMAPSAGAGLGRGRSYADSRGYARDRGFSARGGSGRGRGYGGDGSGARSWSRAAGDLEAGDDFAVGRIVTHPMFGRGKILHKEGAGDTLKLTIRFQDSGTRKILPRHTTLVVHD